LNFFHREGTKKNTKVTILFLCKKYFVPFVRLRAFVKKERRINDAAAETE